MRGVGIKTYRDCKPGNVLKCNFLKIDGEVMRKCPGFEQIVAAKLLEHLVEKLRKGKLVVWRLSYLGGGGEAGFFTTTLRFFPNRVNVHLALERSPSIDKTVRTLKNYHILTTTKGPSGRWGGPVVYRTVYFTDYSVALHYIS